MPEGDTVHAAAARLNRALGGDRLTRTDLRVPAFATSDLSGQVLNEIVPRGKHLLFRISGGVTLHTHFKMEGTWHLYRHGERWRGRRHEVRAVLETDPWVAVGFRLGAVELLPTEREPDVVGHLGPDVLGPDWDPEEVLRRLLADPLREIGDALLDQTVLAGVGNVYKTEICFLRGVNPWTPVGEVNDLPALLSMTKRLMEANRAEGKQVTTGDTRPGRGQWVYSRGGQPCRRCGTPIRSGEQGRAGVERFTYWCPSCQPGTSPGRDTGP